VSLSRTLGSDAQQFRLALRRTRFQGTDRVVVAGQSLQPVERSIRRVAVLLLLACPAALLATAIGGWALARRSLRPVAQMATTAEAIGVDRLSDRLQEPRSRDELAHLASTLNTMLDRVQDGVEEQRRLVADASHELRTPLAAMRSEIDVSLRADDLPPAARDVLASSREEVDGMSRTVDDLLTLAAVDGAALDLRTERVDLAGAAGAVIEGLASLAGRRGVAVEQRGGRVAVLADPLRLAQAVRNVVENAIEFSPEGGTVVVTTSASGRTGLLTVEDAGPGIPAELRARVFERFFRVDASRARATGGSGLGLAISREVVEAQQGRVRAECRAVGAALVIELPAAGVVPARHAATAGSA
jgi:signal transduction histidine kinase